MKLLLDANLSWRLVPKLTPYFSEVVHIDSTHFQMPAKDIEIWRYAKENGFVIVTNDDDFMRLLTFKGFPPKIVLLRMGNQSNQHIFNILVTKKTDIEQLVANNNYGLLEVY